MVRRGHRRVTPPGYHPFVRLCVLPPLLSLAACGHGVVLEAEPQFPRCRQVAPVDGDSTVPPVRWFGPGQADEVVRHFEWCRAVGPMVLLRPDRPRAKPVDSLAIVSFNMDMGAASALDLVDSLRAGAFTGGAPIADFVLLLQETFREGDLVPDPAPAGSGVGRARFPSPRSGDRLDVVRLADSLGLDLFYAPIMRSGKGRNPRGLPEDRGNAMLSTVPQSRFVMVELPFAGTRRVAHLATMSGTTSSGREWSLQIANVHFTVGPVGPSALSAARARQARAMTAAVDSVGAVVLGGDLNAFSIFGTAESVQILGRALGGSEQGDGAATRGWQRLDYLFFRLPPGFSTRPYTRLPLSFGSDHYPILGWVVFR